MEARGERFDFATTTMADVGHKQPSTTTARDNNTIQVVAIPTYLDSLQTKSRVVQP